MSRFAKNARVFFFEEPIFEQGEPHLQSVVCPQTGVLVQTSVLPHGLAATEIAVQQKRLLSQLLREKRLEQYVAWYYTPMAREFTNDLQPAVTVYDCMDELSGFAGAPPAMAANEKDLFAAADLVFTGGASLFAAKKKQHKAVYLFPSSVDVAHFARAKTIAREPADQAEIPHPRIGYAGVIDERMDLPLLRYVAERRPDWQIVLLGPVVKIDPQTLPKTPNIHYLGMKPYAELPAYFSGWKVGLLPFALNDSTKFISPTKTPEYLAAGLRVVSTPIRDVMSPYGEQGLAAIGKTPDEFVEAAGSLLSECSTSGFERRANAFLAQSSWDRTWREMNDLITTLLPAKEKPFKAAQNAQKGLVHV